MKLRTPGTIEDTVSLAIGLLGEARCCEVTGRRSSLVKAWADPDDDKRSISLRACVQLDRELVRTGHAAIFAAYLAGAVAPQGVEAPDADGALVATPLDHAMRIVGEAADTLEETATAFRDREIDAGERQRLGLRVRRLMRCLGDLNRSFFAPVPPRR